MALARSSGGGRQRENRRAAIGALFLTEPPRYMAEPIAAGSFDMESQTRPR